jgi:5-methylthioadenosine/S-adenosylhomocysteine deaminase
VLCIHAVQVNADDLARLARSGAAVAHCPRANRRHGHGAAPLGELLAGGLRIGLGTDSAASVAPLDLLAEARAAREIAWLNADEALALATIGGARALGLDAEIGTLTAGKRADLAIVDLGSGSGAAERVLASAPGDVRATYLGGRQVYGRMGG